MGANGTPEHGHDRSGNDESGDAGAGKVVAVGVFDGVHRGHQGLIAQARDLADRLGLPLVALTFDPHPASIVPGRQAPASLAPLADRIALLHAAGADEVVVLPFDEQLAAMEPQAFVDRILVDQLGARAVVVGENFRFGKGASGDVDALRALGGQRGLSISAVALHPADAPWSSSRVRTALASGDVQAAALILGRPYRLAGVIVHGDHRGRELGYPTANLAVEGHPAIPADGVYAGWLQVAGSPDRWPAAISVGTNPQFDGRQHRIEAFVIDQRGLDLYGAAVGLDFLHRLRDQQTFDSLEAFIAQMGADVSRARDLLAGSAEFPGD